MTTRETKSTLIDEAGERPADNDLLHGHGAVGLSRRQFGLATTVIAATAATPGEAAPAVAERDIDVRTPDGIADAALFHPAGDGRWPAVLIWTDILGLRPVFRQMGRRLAALGYVVLVPNPFYRVKRAPIVGPGFDMKKPDDRAIVMPMMAALTPDTTAHDAPAFLAFLDAQPQVDRARKAGVQGYCMGGFLAFRTAAAVADRVGALATFHGGGLVTDKPESPHRLIGDMKAAAYCAIADNDDAKDPSAKDQLRQAFLSAKLPATVEVYPGANHGWCVRDNNSYDDPAAERAWAHLLALYKDALT